jgi:hypothetical protein
MYEQNTKAKVWVLAWGSGRAKRKIVNLPSCP